MPRKDSASTQRYACDRPGCTKHYSRPDHLLRHKLNHNRDNVLSCDQCHRTFVRQDLLNRHLERHAQRGASLGRWGGRSGAHSPSSGGPEHFLDHRSENLATSSTETSSHGRDEQGSSDHISHLSPVFSSAPETSLFGNLQGFLPQAEQAISFYSQQPVYHHHLRAQTAPMHDASKSALTFDQHQGADLSQWLPWPADPAVDQPLHAAGNEGDAFRTLASNQLNHAGDLVNGGNNRSTAGIDAPLPFMHLRKRENNAADLDWLFDGEDPLASSHHSHSNDLADPINSISESRTADGMTQHTGRASLETSHELVPEPALYYDAAFFAHLERTIPSELAFTVDEFVRNRLLHFLSSVPELSQTPLFAVPALRCYIYLFFVKFNALYPVLHRPTFQAATAHPMLLSAMIICGAHFADENAHFLAEKIARKLWGTLLSFEDFRPARATLVLLQALLLTEMFGRMMGTRPQHETAHLFHDFIVSIAKRNAVFSRSSVKQGRDVADDRQWRVWAREEEKKRAAFFLLILDAQHAVLFQHTPVLNPLQIDLRMPCSAQLWKAQNHTQWMLQSAQQDETPFFLPSLKASLCQSRAVDRGHSDQLQQFVLLHGLMSVACNLQRQQASQSSRDIGTFKAQIQMSYARMNDQIANASSGLLPRASYSLLQWANIALLANIVDIQIYAGLPTVQGRFIDSQTFATARRSCREWAGTKEARLAVYLSAAFLRSTLRSPGDSVRDSHFDELLHHEWVQYLCTLLLWAYSEARHVAVGSTTEVPQMFTPSRSDGPIQLLDIYRSTRSYLDHISTLDPAAEMAFHPPRQNIPALLLHVESICRGSRWELSREAGGVLRKLVERSSRSA